MFDGYWKGDAGWPEVFKIGRWSLKAFLGTRK